MKILFIGGTGNISKAALDLASKSDAEIFMLNRGNNLYDIPKRVRFIKGDIREFNFIKQCLKCYKFDVVIDWIAYNPNHIVNDIKLFGSQLKQYVFISSASVYEKPPSNYIITEKTPLSNPFWEYAQNKIRCENMLHDEYQRSSFPFTIVRPSHTYHKRVPYVFNSKLHPWTLIDRLINGEKIIVPGDGTSLWTLTHSLDFAKGFIGLIGNDKAIGETFHITSDEVLTWNEILNEIADTVDVKPNVIHIPSDFICHLSPSHFGSLIGDKSNSIVFDNSKIRSFVPSFTANISFKNGIKESVSWYKSNPQLCTVDDNFNQLTNNIINAYEK